MTELQRLMQQIDLETEATQRVFTDFSAVAAHDTIISRMEQGAATLAELFEQGRDQEAYELWESGILETGGTQ